MRSIELFTGAGGLALGVHQAGFHHAAVVAYNRNACDTLRLTSQQLDLQPAPHRWPIGQLAQHIISARAGWFGGTLQEADAAMEASMEWGQRDSPERSGAELARALDETFAFVEACLLRWTPDECDQTFPDEMDGQIAMVSRAWVIYHVLEHDLHHGGKIALILGAHGLGGIDL